MSTDTRSKFLLVVFIVFAIYAILWGLAPFTDLNLPARFILDVSDWPVDRISAPLDRNTMWLSSIGAGLLAALSVFLGGIVVPALKEGNSTIIRFTILAMIVWYVIDGVGSVASGVGSNVVFNTIYLFLVLFPLVSFRSQKLT